MRVKNHKETINSKVRANICARSCQVKHPGFTKGISEQFLKNLFKNLINTLNI